MSNFAFLSAEWPDLYDEARRAERLARVDPRTSCFYARRTLELAVAWLYEADSALEEPRKKTLDARLSEPSMRTLTGPVVNNKMHAIRMKGNDAVHGPAEPVPAKDSVRIAAELFHVMYWLARNYTRDEANLPADGIAFDADVVKRPAAPGEQQQKNRAELKALEDEFARKDAELAAERERNAALDAELADLRAQVAEAKAANAARSDTHDYNEDQTRDLFIDVMLREAGWTLDGEHDREYPVTGMPNASGTGRADYVLWDDDGRPLAVVEAKRTKRSPAEGRHQARLYADALEAESGQRPVVFYTNGYDTWLWDDAVYPPREVRGFYTKEELRLLIQRRARASPAGIAVNPGIAGRPYQLRAIRRIGEEFESGRRTALVVMATGAGKTRTTVALVDQLMRAGWVKRVLFLADRKALVTQTVNAFKQHLPDSNPVNLVTERRTEGRVYVSTYPTMMGLIDETDGERRRFGPGHFDLVVVDEAHRSVYQKYGEIFAYFDSLLLGLTATPKDEVDRNTYRLFELENGQPTDVYSLEDAAADGYLVMPKAVSVPLQFQREGIRYDDLSEEEKDAWDAAEWGEDGEVPDRVEADEVNTYLFNADTVDKALEVLMRRGYRVAGGDRLAKTIVFAKNNAHAEFIAERFNAAYPEFKGGFAQVITHQSDYAQNLVDRFADPGREPHIAISVDMLDTGIDVPEVANLVLFKLVRSKTKFWQMIGRGTRLSPDLFGPGRDKEDFLVFDLCQNIEFFNQDLPSSEGHVAPSLGERLLRERLELLRVL
ncbi:DEAD/DEAH box helicase family protein, partial [Streptomonospora algeriensis]